MMRRLVKTAILVAALGLVCSCTSYYHKVTYNVGLKDYEPNAITVLPAVVGSFSGAELVVERQLSLEVQAWGIKVVEPGMVKDVERGDLLKIVEDVQKERSTSAAHTQKLGERLKADTFLLPVVVDWSYSTSGERKFARVELLVKLVAASTGEVVWQYNEAEEKEYWVLKPELKEISGRVVKKIVEEMPKKGDREWEIL